MNFDVQGGKAQRHHQRPSQSVRPEISAPPCKTTFDWIAAGITTQCGQVAVARSLRIRPQFLNPPNTNSHRET